MLGFAVALYLGFVLFCVFMLYRNQWVYEQRTKVLFSEDGIRKYDELLSYGDMLWRFWVWDVEKLKVEEEKSDD